MCLSDVAEGGYLQQYLSPCSCRIALYDSLIFDGEV